MLLQGWSERGQADVGPERLQFALPGSEVALLYLSGYLLQSYISSDHLSSILVLNNLYLSIKTAVNV